MNEEMIMDVLLAEGRMLRRHKASDVKKWDLMEYSKMILNEMRYGIKV